MRARWPSILVPLHLVLSSASPAASDPAALPTTRPSVSDPLTGDVRWRLGPPLIEPADRPQDPCHAIKDPSIVRHNGQWHVFCTIRSQKRTHQIEYLSFPDFEHAAQARRAVLACHPGFFCAPQVLYFSPQKRWYLIYQAVLDEAKGMVPACSTTTDIADPTSWSRPFTK